MIKPFYQDNTLAIYCGDVREILPQLEHGSVQTVITSPPYYGLRDYGVDGQLGLEKSPQEYVERMTEVFDMVKSVLRPDGTLWLNLGDSYANPSQAGGGDPTIGQRNLGGKKQPCSGVPTGLKPKDLIGIPWRVAFALQSSGWYLRQDIIWHKLNPMPEGVKDRCTKAHEYIFLMSKSGRYFFSSESITETAVKKLKQKSYHKLMNQKYDSVPNDRWKDQFDGRTWSNGTKRNKRSVWSVPTDSLREIHFATLPQKLIEPCILAGSNPGDTVLDPFGGSGTTALVANKHGRKAVLIEINKKYCEIALKRNRQAMLPVSGA